MAQQDGGTSGGWRGMNGKQRQLALALGGGFLAIMLAILVANAESTLSDLEASGVRERADHVWSWEWTSAIAWLSVLPVIWWAVARFRPPRFSWPVLVAALIVGSLIASGWHIAVMVALRQFYYAALGEKYHFFGVIADRLLYEYRKDFGTYLQFVGLSALAQWLLARLAAPAPAPPLDPPVLLVADGSITHRVPIDAIDWAAAAGNYVEIAWEARVLLHRSTLAALSEALGPGFARIHRGRLVRRDAVRRVETERSGDFTVTLESGATLRGSRRYRGAL